MKQWWQELSLREKQSVSVGSIAIAIFIIYSWIWSPLDHKITAMRTQIEQNQKLLAWMEAADKQLANSAKQIQSASTTSTSKSLLSVAQNQIKQSSLSNQSYRLRQAESDSVQLSFKQVDFDKLITWLSDASRQQNLMVSQLTVAPSDTPGIVSAELQLTS
jgi:type II secretory pathway component PulM